jgi:NAD(P)-dependent dehydrogenase (short-subunit alcohol dehydrogenase family)
MTGKVVIVTGASRGIGAGLVAGYRGRGWAVVATARSIEPSQDPDVFTLDADITDPPAADRVTCAALERFGRIDALVNNARTVTGKPFTDYTATDYTRTVGVSMTGFFWLTQRAIAEMAARYGGHVVSVSSALAGSGTPSALAALAHGGLIAATRSLAVEYAAYGVRVNAVSTGIIATPVHPAEACGALRDRLPPLGRVGQVGDVVDGVLFLESSPYITGEILHIDGGQIASH